MIRMNLQWTGWVAWLVESVGSCLLIEVTDIEIGNRCSESDFNLKRDTAARRAP